MAHEMKTVRFETREAVLRDTSDNLRRLQRLVEMGELGGEPAQAAISFFGSHIVGLRRFRIDRVADHMEDMQTALEAHTARLDTLGKGEDERFQRASSAKIKKVAREILEYARHYKIDIGAFENTLRGNNPP